MTKHVVEQGECFLSLAERYGFADPSTIADDGANAELRGSRDVLGILRPGDEVTIPARTSEEHSCAAGASHRFEKQGKPPIVKVKLLDRHGQPRKNLRYEIAFDDIVRKGSTDGGGFLNEKIPPRAELAKLTLVDGDDREVMELALGHVDPIDDDAGAQQRLANLGYDDGTEHGEWTDSKRALLRAFQSNEGLDPSGELDASTKDALKQKHGC